MAGLLGKIEKVVDSAISINNIVSKVNSSGILNGVNLNSLTGNGGVNLKSISNINPADFQNIGAKISANTTSMSENIVNELTSSVDVNQFTNMASSINMSDLGVDMSEFNNIPGFDPSMLEGIEFR